MRADVMSSMRPLATLSIALASTLLGCTDAPTEATASTSRSTQASPSPKASTALHSSGSASAPGASQSPAPSAVAAPMQLPSEIAACETSGAHHGGFVPTAEQLARAVAVAGPDACLPDAIAGQAVRACAAKLGGATAIKLSTDRFEGTPKGCEVRLAGASADGRTWIVLRSVFRQGASFMGTTKAIELTSSGPKLYLDATGDHEQACPTESGAAPPAQEAAGPEGWSKLELGLKRFLCERAS